MAISKILYMKDCGSGFHGRHLKTALEYVMNPEKTRDGRLIGGINCQPDNAFEQMKATKRKFGKIDKRQGYHIILSFKEGEIDSDKAYEITRRFVEEYLGKEYEAVFCVHDNTDHIHSHTVFNSVSFVDGKKYRYEKGDWAKEIQPITNRLCEEFGLSTIDIETDKNEKHEYYHEWNEYRDGKFVWSDMIVRDLDACILQAGDFEQFLELLHDKGYEVKQGKYLAVKPPGMNRFKRCKTLGENYSEERIRERIPTEDLAFYQAMKQEIQPEIVKCYVRRYRRAKMSGIQKRYYAKLYRIGKLKKKPYSQAWKYKNDIMKMQKLQQQYLFLVRHNVHNVVELAATVDNLTGKKKEASTEKSRVYRSREKCKTIFAIADDLEELKLAENSYLNGDKFFEEEHNQWINLMSQLQQEGYSLEEVEQLKEYYREQYSIVSSKEKVVFKELNLGKSIVKDMISDNEDRTMIEDKTKNKITERTKEKQPIR